MNVNKESDGRSKDYGFKMLTMTRVGKLYTGVRYNGNGRHSAIIPGTRREM